MHVARIGIVLVALALIAGTVGCGEGGADAVGDRESYTLTVDGMAGGVVTVDSVSIPGRGTFTYDAGTVVSLNATADSGYQFVEWTGDVGTVDNVRASQTIITVNGSYFITANFEVPTPVRYRLAIFSTPGGSVTTPGEDGFTYDAGTVVNLVATPARRYEFVRWTGSADTITDVNAASTNITMNDDYYICAHFREEHTCG